MGAGAEGTSEALGFVAMDYIERTPHAINSRQGKLLAVAVNALLAYAVALGRPSVRLVIPARTSFDPLAPAAKGRPSRVGTRSRLVRTGITAWMTVRLP